MDEFKGSKLGRTGLSVGRQSLETGYWAGENHAYFRIVTFKKCSHFYAA